MKPELFLWLLLSPISAVAITLPQQLAVPGGIIEITVDNNDVPAPEVFFQQQRVLVLADLHHWVAVVGIPLATKPGQYNITVHSSLGERKIVFNVADKEYPAQYITLKNKRMVNPNPDDLKRIKADRIPINKALLTWTQKTDIDMRFIPPVDGRLSSLFGLKRFFNMQPRNPHSGLDIAAPAGTPIKAPAPARVINTGNYYYDGNSAFLDHGQGLITGYFHMTTINVKPGQQLKRGDIIGTVGATGRVTGPHLHWNVYLNRTRVDPALFIEHYIPILDARNKPKKATNKNKPVE